MKINDLDLGVNPFRTGDYGQVVGDVVIEGAFTASYARGSKRRSWTVSTWITGGSQNATEILVRKVEEMASNKEYQPVFISWSSLRITPQDGWYIIDNFKPDYHYTQSGYIKADLTVTYDDPPPPRRMGMFYVGGPLPTQYTAPPSTCIVCPPNFAFHGQMVRTGAEGGLGHVESTNNLIGNPAEFETVSSSISDFFRGAARVYDDFGNAVLLDGTSYPATWTEIRDVAHALSGANNLTIANSLLMLSFEVGVSSPNVAQIYLWNPFASRWLLVCTLNHIDNAGGAGYATAVTLTKCSPEEIACTVRLMTANNFHAIAVFRLRRGEMYVRIEDKNLSVANSQPNRWYLGYPISPKAFVTSGVGGGVAIMENSRQAGTLAATTDAGWNAGIVPNAAYPVLAGFLYQQTPAFQGQTNQNVNLGLGENALPTQQGTRYFGIYATPWRTPTQLQAEAEAGTLSGGAVSAADGTASGGNACKIPSGTVVGAQDIMLTYNFLAGGNEDATHPPPGTYKFYVFVRSGTSGAGSTDELQIQVLNSTDAQSQQSVNLKPNGVTTSYQPYSPGAPVNLPNFANAGAPSAPKTVQVLVKNLITTTVDWFIDEVIAVPVSMDFRAAQAVDSYNAPQDLWQQFIVDRTTDLVVI